MRKLLPPVLLLLLIALMGWVHVGFDMPVVLPEGLRHLGGFLVVLGLGLAIVARAQFARAQTTVHTFHEPQKLVTSGVFRFSRNPMYVGLSLVAGGAAVFCGAITSLALATLFIVVTDRWYIPFEERMLQATFGADFERYTCATRRWL